MIHYLEQNHGAQATLTMGIVKSTKIPDPKQFSNGQNSNYESWKTQIEGKLTENQDHFPSKQAKMIYFFGRTTGDAQKHLKSRYSSDVENPF